MEEENFNPEIKELPVEDGSYTEEIMTPEMVSTREIPEIEENVEEYKENENIEDLGQGGL